MTMEQLLDGLCRVWNWIIQWIIQTLFPTTTPATNPSTRDNDIPPKHLKFKHDKRNSPVLHIPREFASARWNGILAPHDRFQFYTICARERKKYNLALVNASGPTTVEYSDILNQLAQEPIDANVMAKIQADVHHQMKHDVSPVIISSITQEATVVRVLCAVLVARKNNLTYLHGFHTILYSLLLILDWNESQAFQSFLFLLDEYQLVEQFVSNVTPSLMSCILTRFLPHVATRMDTLLGPDVPLEQLCMHWLVRSYASNPSVWCGPAALLSLPISTQAHLLDLIFMDGWIILTYAVFVLLHIHQEWFVPRHEVSNEDLMEVLQNAPALAWSDHRQLNDIYAAIFYLQLDTITLPRLANSTKATCPQNDPVDTSSCISTDTFWIPRLNEHERASSRE